MVDATLWAYALYNFTYITFLLYTRGPETGPCQLLESGVIKP